MKKPLITIGMASFDDHLRVRSTIQNIRLHQIPCEIVLVDNNPSSKHGEMNASLFKNLESGGTECQYIPFDKVVGTSVPRDLVFRKAKGDWVFVCDSHIELFPNALKKFSEWAEKNPNSNDLLTGPVVWDTLTTWATHYNDAWREGSWGIWSLAWQCQCGFNFSTMNTPNGVAYVPLMPPQIEIKSCPQCSKEFPKLAWSAHEQVLVQSGYKMLGSQDSEPFEIPACGLGLFGCRKDAWLGFNHKLRGWGGEEWCIHTKYRQAGAKCLSLPFMRWSHSWGNPYGPADQRTTWDLIRNYVIWFSELGLDYNIIRKNCGKIGDQEWSLLMGNPSSPPDWPNGERPSCCPATKAQHDAIGIQTSSAIADTHNQDKITELVEQCLTVSKLSQSPSIPVCDMILVDACRTGQCLANLLMKHHQKANRFIAILGMTAYWARGEDGQFGMFAALSNFIHHEKRWKAIYWGRDGSGLVVLGCDKQDWPEDEIYFMPPGKGVGTELTALLKSLGVTSQPGCQCTAKANEMDMLGLAWCKQNRESILDFLRKGQESFGWGAVLGAGWRSVTSGLLWTIGISDPLAGLFDEACRRWEEKRKG